MRCFFHYFHTKSCRISNLFLCNAQETFYNYHTFLFPSFVFLFVSDEAEDFNREWETKTRSGMNAIDYGHSRMGARRQRDNIPAILDR